MKIMLRGNAKEFEAPMTALEIAASISHELKKEAVAAKIDGEVKDLKTVIDHDCEVEFLTFADEEGRRVYRHTASHVLAQAVKALYPDAKLAIGPAIDNGFYYDFDCAESFTTDDFKKIEKEMERVIKANYPLERFELPRAEALELMQSKGEPYKVELINDLPEDAVISFYQSGRFRRSVRGSASAVHQAMSRRSSSCPSPALTGAAPKRTRCSSVIYAHRVPEEGGSAKLIVAAAWKRPRSAITASSVKRTRSVRRAG